MGGCVIAFDVRTALLLGALTTLLLGLLLAAVSRDFAPMLRPALHLWLRANLLQPIGFVLFALRGQINDTLSVVLANAVLVVAFADYARALHRLMQRPDPVRLAWGAVGSVALTIAVFTWWMDLIAVRIVVASTVLGLLSLLAMRPLIGNVGGNGSASRHAIAAVFAAGAVVLLFRAGYTVIHPDEVREGLHANAVQALVFGSGAVLPLLTSYGFLLLCNERMRAELAHNAATDFLTGALNRGAIEQQGMALLARTRRREIGCAALVADVDHFKRINDAYGHAAGDAALREIVRRLQDATRAGDTLGRLGGEEFLVLLDEADMEQARLAAERLRQAIDATPLQLDGHAHPVTISIGVAVSSARDASFSDLLRRADRALYAAKNSGRNRVELAPSP